MNASKTTGVDKELPLTVYEALPASDAGGPADFELEMFEPEQKGRGEGVAAAEAGIHAGAHRAGLLLDSNVDGRGATAHGIRGAARVRCQQRGRARQRGL